MLYFLTKRYAKQIELFVFKSKNELVEWINQYYGHDLDKKINPNTPLEVIENSMKEHAFQYFDILDKEEFLLQRQNNVKVFGL